MSKKVQIELIVDSSEAQKNISEVNEGLQQTDEKLKQTNKSAKKGKKGFSGLTVGAKAFGTALKAAGIGLIIAALTALGSALTSNQKVLNTFNLVIGTATQFMGDLVSSVVNAIEAQGDFAGQFDAIGRIVTAWGKALIATYSNVFNSLKTGILGSQLVWEKSFFGDGDESKIKELQEGIAQATSQIGDNISTIGSSLYTIGTSVGEAISEVANVVVVAGTAISEVSAKTSFENTKLLQELKRNSQIAAAESRGLIEQKDREAEKLRQTRDEERNSIADRIKANNDLKAVLKDQEKQMLANADTVIKAAKLQFELSGKDEDYIALLDARTEKLGVLAQIEGFISEQKSNDLALDKEQIELTNSKTESESKLSIEQKRFNAEQIQDELLRLEALKQIDLLEAEQEAVRLQAIIDNANAGTQAEIDAQIILDEFTEQSRQTNLTRDAEISKAKIEIANKEESAKKAALDGYASALSGISGLLGQETAAGKSIAIASSLVSTYAAIAGQLAVFSQPGAPPIPGFAIAQAIATGVVGLANVKKIASVKIPKTSSGGSSATGSLPTAPAVPSLPPAFNIVGSSGTNQLADAIGGQSQQPIQAFVVASEVTSAQALERNTIEGATIG